MSTKTTLRLANSALRMLAPHCMYCGVQIVGEVQCSMHRDGFGKGPELPLCETCGSDETPTVEAIWAKCGKSKGCIACHRPFTATSDRIGSYHKECVPTNAKGLYAVPPSKWKDAARPVTRIKTRMEKR